jgi:hypothetical protein
VNTTRVLAFLAIMIVGGLAAGHASARNTHETAGQGLRVTIARHGLRITIPGGWHGRIYQRRAGLPILQAGNFRLPENDDDVGTKATKRMRRASIFISLLEACPGSPFPHVRLPVRIRRSDFLPMFEGVPRSHAFARRLLTVNGRKFQLWLQFGRRPAVASALQHANDVIETLGIDARPTCR